MKDLDLPPTSTKYQVCWVQSTIGSSAILATSKRELENKLSPARSVLTWDPDSVKQIVPGPQTRALLPVTNIRWAEAP